MKKKRLTIGGALMLIMLAVAATFNITFFIASEYYNVRLGDLQKQQAQYEKFDEVRRVVDKNFVGEIDPQTAMDGAMAGYIEGLGDRWSSYLTAAQVKQLDEDNKNTYVGVGVTISYEKDTMYQLTSVTRDSPADKAGIKPFDVLFAVDGKSVTEFASDTELVNAVRGKAGTKVALTVLRDGKELTFEAERGEVYNTCVESKMLSNHVGFVRISGFERNVDVEFSQKVDELLSQGATALVFDVRLNPGGYLDVLVKMLDKLLPKGTVISTVDINGKTQVFESDENCIEVPMAVLVNQYSISAAEFFAAALQEYGAATIVGEHTGGKGYAQEVIRLSDGSAINLSIIRYYTPKGVSLADSGVAPDVECSLTEEQLYNFYHLTEKDDPQLQKAVEALQTPATH